MTIRILIECPSCRQQHEIFLKKSVNAVIIPCSECKSLISFSSGKTRIVAENLLKKIDDMKTIDDLRAVFNIIDLKVEKALEKNVRENAICDDDVLNIKIAIEHGDFWDKYMGDA